MTKILFAVAAIALLAMPAQATPLISTSAAAQLADQDDVVVQVKWKAKHWKVKAKPYGWSQGRKVGWRGRGMPPGQYKKYYGRF
jgi:hypothetical protein